MIARVILDVAADRVFDYRIPLEITDKVALGSRVQVPLGSRILWGYVLELVERSEIERLRDVIALDDSGSYVSPVMLNLVKWMADYYICQVDQAMRAVLPAPVRRKGRAGKHVLTAVPAESAPVDVKITAQQSMIMDLLRQHGRLPVRVLAEKAGVSDAPIRTLAKKGFLTISQEESLRVPSGGKTYLATTSLKLMQQQTEALASIVASIRKERTASERNDVFLLHGVTGSGKTEVYLQAIAECLAMGKGAIVLIPEISLTPQTMERFIGRFGRRVAVLHSRLSDGERHDEWHRIREGKADVVVGARSAVFAPLQKPGLIVVDEEHEPAYKQEDMPRYSARDVAVMRGHLEGCPVILGSATPCLESLRNALSGRYRLLEMPARVDHNKMPEVKIVDMRLQKRDTGEIGFLSQPLMEAIARRLERSEQIMLFINRRGYATSLVCPSCGFVAKCDQCSVSLTYHKEDESLKCHICGHTRAVPVKCPTCFDPAYRYSGVGTQRVESIVRKCFPHAVVQRMDTDVTRAKDSHDRILGDFRSGRIQILIGTQMIAKGLHFPNVTLVGVINADVSLHLPDFRAAERTFQLLAQVAGRAGRGDVPGEVIIQTFTPFHPALQAVRRIEYRAFCDQEMEFRKELFYPPFSRLTCVTFRSASETKAVFFCGLFGKKLGKRLPTDAQLSEAVAAPISKAKGKYRFQLLLRASSIKSVAGPLRETLKEVRLPPEVQMSLDVDSMSIL